MASTLTRRAPVALSWCQQPPRTPAVSHGELRRSPGVKKLVEECAGSRNAALKWRNRGFRAECKRNQDGTYRVFAWWPHE